MSSEMARHQKTDALAPRSGFGTSCQPSNYTEATHFCQQLSKSGIVPKNFANDPMAIFVCIEAGERMGYSILQSLQNIAVINGKPTIYGDELLARVKRSEACEDIIETVKDGVATCEARRKGCQPVIRTFSTDDAKRANLLNKPGPWQQYPQRMLQMRARGFALRDQFADVLSGFVAREEVEDEIIDARTRQPAARPEASHDVTTPSLQSVLDSIAGAQSSSHLDAVIAEAKALSPRDADVARNHFVDRRKELAKPEEGKARKVMKKMMGKVDHIDPPSSPMVPSKDADKPSGDWTAEDLAPQDDADSDLFR
jgi:hypothetical protein